MILCHSICILIHLLIYSINVWTSASKRKNLHTQRTSWCARTRYAHTPTCTHVHKFVHNITCMLCVTNHVQVLKGVAIHQATTASFTTPSPTINTSILQTPSPTTSVITSAAKTERPSTMFSSRTLTQITITVTSPFPTVRTPAATLTAATLTSTFTTIKYRQSSQLEEWW